MARRKYRRATSRGVVHGAVLSGRPTALTGPWLAMAEHAGGVSELAEALGVTRGALYRWAVGTRTPHATIRGLVTMWARRRGLADPWTTA